MNAERWRRVSAIFDQVVEAAPSARDELLATLCDHDAQLRSEVAALLHSDSGQAAFERGVDAAQAALVAAWSRPSAGTIDAGERIGPWRVVRELGQGGMGVVLLAERVDGQFEQRGALKLIKLGMDSELLLARFLRERQILARLEHPHIARLLDGGVTDEGRPYFAMEYVDGQPLLRHCAERPLGLEQRIRLFVDICAAVQFAHRALIVHLDLKSSNVLVTSQGVAKLLDFGIAKLLGADVAMTQTIDSHARPLTPAYAAPEQLRGEAVSTTTDVYALGAILYELLTGRRPYDFRADATAQEIRQLVDTTTPIAPSARGAADAPVPARRLRGDLDTIVLTALKRAPERRYATADALAEDLNRFLGGEPIRARRDNAWYRCSKFGAAPSFWCRLGERGDLRPDRGHSAGAVGSGTRTRAGAACGNGD